MIGEENVKSPEEGVNVAVNNESENESVVQKTNDSSSTNKRGFYDNRNNRRGDSGRFGRSRRDFNRRDGGKPAPKLFSCIASIDRVSKGTSGGKSMSFSVVSIVGNENGQVGVGLGKGVDVSEAIEKSKNKAKKNMIILPMKNLDSITHDVLVKYCGTRILIKKGSAGHIASNLMKNIFKAAGLKNMVAKIIGTSSSVKKIAYGTIKALQSVESLDMIASRRGITVDELNKRRQDVINLGLVRAKKKI